MQTTLCSLAIDENCRAVCINVGDSRLYVCSGTRIFQITQDHSLVGDLLRKGVITEEEARVHPQKNIITRAIGSECDVDVDIFDTVVQSGNVVISCTDGLHGLLTEEEIAGVVSVDIEDSAEKLISMANDKGGNDNITVAAVRIS